jgi:hypothetical protein
VTPTMSMQRLDQCQPTANRTVEAAKRKAEGADPTAAETGLGAGASAADATETAETARTASTARAVDPTPAISVGGEKDDPAAAALLCGGGGERERITAEWDLVVGKAAGRALFIGPPGSGLVVTSLVGISGVFSLSVMLSSNYGWLG